MSSNADKFFMNDQGAKVFYDHSQQSMLDIPILNDMFDKGVIYKVLSVGFFGFLDKPTVTIEQDGDVVLYRLPDELIGWVLHCMSVSQQGSNFFPEFVEFGYLSDTKRFYAHIY